MSLPLPHLATHKGPRGDILLELKCAQPLTAKQLAGKLGVSANAIRHHLKELEAEGLIVYGREQRGVGAPTFAYRLSAAGEEQFPRRYEETLTELLQRVTERAGRNVVVELQQLDDDVAPGPLGHPLQQLGQRLFVAPWELLLAGRAQPVSEGRGAHPALLAAVDDQALGLELLQVMTDRIGGDTEFASELLGRERLCALQLEQDVAPRSFMGRQMRQWEAHESES